MKDKKVYLELLRILASALVILNHTPVFYLFAESYGFHKILYSIQSIIVTINVPLFLMISGATLLGREEDYFTILKKRIFKILAIIVIFNFLSYLITAYKNNAFDILDYINLTISNKVELTVPYWFLYSYLAFLIMLPIIRKIANQLTKKDFYALLILYSMFGVLIPTLHKVSLLSNMNIPELSSSFSLPIITCNIVFYPLIGYYLDSKISIEELNKKMIIFGLLMFSLTILISLFLLYYENYKTTNVSQTFLSTFNYVQAIIIFILTKYLVSTYSKIFNSKVNRLVCKIGVLTFGIYLFDPIFQKLFLSTYHSIVKDPLSTTQESYLWILLSMTIGGLLTSLLKKCTFFKKLL